MLIHELGKKERMLVVEEASIRSRYLWPEGAEASLAHGVWSQLLKDLATLKLHYYAVEDWEGSDDHWFASGFGVAQSYLDDLLRGWAFLGDGREFAVTEIVPGDRKVTSKVCQTCHQDKPIEEYYSNYNGSGARLNSCPECRNNSSRDVGVSYVRSSGDAYEAEEIGVKQCKTCLKTKPKTEFHRHPHAASGRMLHCAACTCAKKAAAKRLKAAKQKKTIYGK